MSNEALIYSQLQIVSGNLEYRSYPNTFQGDRTTAKGPSPGAFQAVTSGTGTQVSLTNLSTPAYAVIKNLDDTNYVDVGLVVSGTLYPLMEVQAGESYTIRFSRNMTTTILYIRANTAACEVVVEAFES